MDRGKDREARSEQLGRLRRVSIEKLARGEERGGLVKRASINDN